MTWSSWIKSVTGDAQAASAQTGVPVATILAQWGVETGWGTSRAWVEGNNYAGVSPGGHVAYYGSRQAGLDAYVRTMNLDYYTAVRSAGEPYAAADALAVSPWAAGHYNGGRTLRGALDMILGTDPSLGSSTSSNAGATPDTATQDSTISLPIVGNPLDPFGIVGGVGSAVAEGAGKVVLTGIFVAGGIGLVVLGAWRLSAPARERATQAAGQAAMIGAAA